MEYYRKDSPKFYPENFDSWKNKMRTHLFCLGIDYWLITRNKVAIKTKDELTIATEDEKKIFSLNMITREALINALSE